MSLSSVQRKFTMIKNQSVAKFINNNIKDL